MKNLKFTLKAWPVITVVTIGLCVLTKLLAAAFGIELTEQYNVDQVRQLGVYAWQTFTSQPLARCWADEFVRHFLKSLAFVLLAAPLLEEALFRGLLYALPSRKGLARVLTGRVFQVVDWIIIILSSVLFAAAHYLAQPWPDNAFLSLFFFGVAQCWLYRKTNLWCAMLNHALFNLTNLVLLFVIPQ